METLFGCMALLVLVLALVGPIGALVAFFKTRKRLNETQLRLEILEGEVRQLRTRSTLTGAATSTSESSEQRPVATPATSAAPTSPPEEIETAQPVEEGTPPSATPAVAEAATPPPVDRTPPPPPQPPKPPRPKIEIDWERWIGVRGAAVLGGVVLALAAILFLKYSIEHGLIPPVVRVAITVAAGIAALIGSETLRKRGYETLSNSLAGTSVVLFYAAAWAAHALYHLIPAPVTWGFMILVTVVCGLLSWSRRSILVAVLGLVGGFATPLLLSTGENRPIGLFTYILLLDVGLIVLARKRRWPLLAVLSLTGTTLYQLLWVAYRMEPDQLSIALVVFAVFAIVYALAQRGETAIRDSKIWDHTQAASVLLAFLFTFYLATRTNFAGGLGEHLAPIAALLLVLSLLALSLARALDQPLLARAAAAADVAVLVAWSLRASFTNRLAWEASAIGVAIALTFQLFRYFNLLRSDPAKLARGTGEWAPLIATAGPFAILLTMHGGRSTSLWPWLAGWVVLAALLVASGGTRFGGTQATTTQPTATPAAGHPQLLAAVGLSCGFVFFLSAHDYRPGFPPMGLFLGLAFAGAVAFQLLALVRRRQVSGRRAELAAATSASILLASTLLSAKGPGTSPLLFFAFTLGLGGLLCLCAMRLPSGKLLLATMAVVAGSHFIWTSTVLTDQSGETLVGMLGCTVGVLLFTAWPFLAGRPLGGDRWALYASALAAPAWFLPLRQLWLEEFGSAAIGALPILMGVVSLGAAMQARRRFATSDPQHKRGLVWFLAVSLAFVSVAIPLQLDKEWITLGWALLGCALIALWRRLDHAGLKYFALALLAVVSARLLLNPEVLLYHPRASFPVVNWLMYTYLVPAAALLVSARILEPLEVQRRLGWEEKSYSGGRAWAAIGCGASAILVLFAWINLTIFDYFSTGSRIQIGLDHHMGRDLTLSLAWALFALGLLAIGMARKSSSLRWVSLCFLILTIAKTFLYDLGELEDLYRVGSLVGLAISLIAVSLAYQRFVFGTDREAGEEEQP